MTTIQKEKYIYSNMFMKELSTSVGFLCEDDEGILNKEMINKLRTTEIPMIKKDSFPDFSLFMQNPSYSLFGAILID